MEQLRKRIRKNENTNGRADSSDTDLSNNDQELVKTIPTLVSEIFLEGLRDVKLLKTCRLVCKSWNVAASKSLRACSVVSVKENSLRLKDFAELLQKRELRSFQHFPSPFQNVHVEGGSFTEPTFINLVFAPRFTCTRLIVFLPNEDGIDGMDLDQSQLSLFLAANKDSITDLTINAKTNPGLQLNEELMSIAIQLTSLKRLTFIDECRRCTHIQFVGNIMRMCRPAVLSLVMRDYESFPSLFLQDQVAHIKDLGLVCLDISRDALTYLANTRFQLITLSIFAIYRGSWDVPGWYSILENVSPSLMQFWTNVPIGTNLRFPKLKEIQIRNYRNILCEFTPNNFPLLTKFVLNVHLPLFPILTNCTAPHTGVQNIVIEAPDMTLYDDIAHDLFMLLTFVSRQFPNVTSRDFSIPRFQSSTLTDICKVFPSLKTLKLDGECYFFSFAGFKTSTLNLGVPFGFIPRKESILDFEKLEIIKFGSKFSLCPDMIRHCLPRIRKLKKIELYWNRTLSAPLFRYFVGRLEKIVISDSDYFATEMMEVQQLLPNVVIML